MLEASLAQEPLPLPPQGCEVINRWSHEFKYYLSLKTSQVHSQWNQASSRGRRSCNLSWGHCWGHLSFKKPILSFKNPNFLWFLMQTFFKVLKSFKNLWLVFVPCYFRAFRNCFWIPAATPSKFVVWNVWCFKATPVWELKYLFLFFFFPVILNSLFIPVWSEMPYLKIQHGMWCLKSFSKLLCCHFDSPPWCPYCALLRQAIIFIAKIILKGEVEMRSSCHVKMEHFSLICMFDFAFRI